MTAPTRIAVLASGRGSNLQAILDAIGSGRLPAEVVGVFSDRPTAQALQRVAPAPALGACTKGIQRPRCLRARTG